MAYFKPTSDALEFRLAFNASFFGNSIKERLCKGNLLSISTAIHSLATCEPDLNSKVNESNLFVMPNSSGEDSPALSGDEERRGTTLKEVAGYLVDSSLIRIEAREPEKVPHHLLNSRHYSPKSFFFENIKEDTSSSIIEDHLRNSFHLATNNGLSFRGAKVEIVFYRGLWCALVHYENSRQGDFLYFNMNSRAKHIQVLGENYKVYELIEDCRRKVKDWVGVILRNLRPDIEKTHVMERIASRLGIKNITVEEIMHYRSQNHVLIRVSCIEDAEDIVRHFTGQREGPESMKANIHPNSSLKRSKVTHEMFESSNSLDSFKPDINVLQPIMLVPAKPTISNGIPNLISHSNSFKSQHLMKEELYPKKESSSDKMSKFRSMYSNDDETDKSTKASKYDRHYDEPKKSSKSNSLILVKDTRSSHSHSKSKSFSKPKYDSKVSKERNYNSTRENRNRERSRSSSRERDRVSGKSAYSYSHRESGNGNKKHSPKRYSSRYYEDSSYQNKSR